MTIPQFEWVDDWARLPADMHMVDIPGIAVHADGRVVALTRGTYPILIFDSDGKVLERFGSGLFTRPHGISLSKERLVCVDDEGQQVVIIDLAGSVLEVIKAENQSALTGYVPGYPHSVRRAAPPFCYPTHAALTDIEDLLVTDGYGNGRVHRFDRQRRLVSSWGQPGDGPGEFVIPHGMLLESDRLLVCDRENERIQILGHDGSFLEEWPGVHCPNNVVQGTDGLYYVAELGRKIQSRPQNAHLIRDAIHARVTARSTTGELVAEWRRYEDEEEDHFFAPHAIAIASNGDVYVGQVRSAYGQGLAPPGPTLHKLTRV